MKNKGFPVSQAVYGAVSHAVFHSYSAGSCPYHHSSIFKTFGYQVK